MLDPERVRDHFAAVVLLIATAIPATADQAPQPAAVQVASPPTDPDAATAASRPLMRQLAAAAPLGRIPSRREIAAGRPVVRRRFHEEFSHTETQVGARTAAETLLAAARSETDDTLRWVLLDEARRLGEASGQAGIVSRSFAAAAGFYEVDDIAGELRSLRQFPIRVLDGQRATALAQSAERLAARAAEERRTGEAVVAEDLASRAWEKAGNIPAARAAAARCMATDRAATDRAATDRP